LQKREFKELRCIAKKAVKCLGMTAFGNGKSKEPYVMVAFDGTPSSIIPFSLEAVRRIIPAKLAAFYESCIRI
jgi:hypothetical protein